MNVEKVAKYYSKLLDEEKQDEVNKIRKEMLTVRNKNTFKTVFFVGTIQFLVFAGLLVTVYKYGKNIPGLYNNDAIQIKTLLGIALVATIVSLGATESARIKGSDDGTQ